LGLSYTQVVWVPHVGVGRCSFVRPRLGKVNVKHLILLRKVNFYRRLLKSCDTFLCGVFITFLSDNVCNDDVLMLVFCSRSDVINNAWLSFKNYVNR